MTAPLLSSTKAKSAEITGNIHALMPGWYVPATITLAALSCAGLILAGVLLALPTSNAYFRRPPLGRLSTGLTARR